MIGELSKRFAKQQFNFERRIQFYREFAALTRSGLSKTEAIELGYQVASDEGRRKGDPTAVVLRSILTAMRNGAGFGVALRPWVPTDDTMVMAAAENAENFPEQIEAYCEAAKKKRAIRGTILSGLAYPAFLIILLYALLVYFGREVVPQIGQLLPPEEWEGPAALLALLGRFAESYALAGALVIASAAILVALTLPRWAKGGRSLADKLPIYGLYRMYTGISFMLAISSLTRGGLPAKDAIDLIRPHANPYVRHRLTVIRRHMLNGKSFGDALHLSKLSWPDKRLNLTIQIFSETQDLSQHLARLAYDWLTLSQERVTQRMAVTRAFAMTAVFGVIMLVVAGMYSLQDQLTGALGSSGNLR